MVISQNAPRAGCKRDSAAHKCAFVNTSGRPASSAILFFMETSAVFQKQVQKKNKCRNVASCCSCPVQMVPLCRRVPSSPPSPAAFSHKLPLKLLLSVAIILAGTHTHTHTKTFLHNLFHFLSILRETKKKHCEEGVENINMAFL